MSRRQQPELFSIADTLQPAARRAFSRRPCFAFFAYFAVKTFLLFNFHFLAIRGPQKARFWLSGVEFRRFWQSLLVLSPSPVSPPRSSVQSPPADTPASY